MVDKVTLGQIFVPVLQVLPLPVFAPIQCIHSLTYWFIHSYFLLFIHSFIPLRYTGLSKKMDGIWNRYNLKSTGRIYTFGVLKCSEKFKVLDLP